MTTHLIRGGALAFTLVLALPLFGANTVHAAASTTTPTTYRNTSEGTAYSSYSGRRFSSSIRRKIDRLDDDRVEQMPVPILIGITPKNLTRNFGDPRDGGARTHEGLDIMAPKDAYVVSPTDAVVTSMGTGPSSGNYVYTANPGGETFAYMHLDAIADGLTVGDELKPGGFIGYVGNTGNASGGATHLHFEIRDGRTPTDPYPRLTQEFTLAERIDTLTSILDDADDEDAEVALITSRYKGVLLAARAQGIELPKPLAAVLDSAPTASTAVFARDLTVGSRGDDVVALQTILISAMKGLRATALATAGATGYFGPATQAALVEYQAAVGISPASGYFGPLTRARISQ